ncbi:GCN5-related N-acetyltransferase [Elusimicrobium minutum Pei191]|uniref:GCN5-related N-acetyltransferase n=1 Tax=Elusimicrobium minutum (strain Pei191) TaxID=445932 RepID=B2KD21_ELUMP|nr:GNAT family protein [Elusimicrobium minutum]ACC98417.1 GCN5-related N-acetyltransferase [Elusimicrobium minutum Pei191]
MLNNKNISLRAFEESDAETVRAWRFAPQNYDYFYEFVMPNKIQNDAWFQNTLKKTSEINFIIETKDAKPIGMIALIDIDNRSQKCEMGRVLIGEEDYRSKGLGREIIKTILDYAFNHLNMHKVYCEVFADNAAALGLYKKCGFEEDGYFKQHVYKNGEFKDIVHLSIFKN